MKKLLIALFIPWAFNSCIKPVEIDLPKHEERLVINSLFSPQEVIKVNVSASVQIDENEAPFLNNANISLFKNGEYIENLSYMPMEYQDGNYFSQHIPEVGSTYEITVEHPDYKSVSSNNRVPSQPIVESVVLSENVYHEDYFDFLELTLTFNDPEGVKNYYEVSGYFIDTYQFDNQIDTIPYPIYFNSDDLVIKSEETEEYFLETLVFTDKLIDGQTYPLTLRFQDIESYYGELDADEIYVVLKSVSEEYYNYMKKLGMNLNGDYFDIWESYEPVQMYTNIENGFGVFAAYNSTTISVPLNQKMK